MARPYPPAVQMGMSPMMGQQGMVAPHMLPPGQQRFVPGAQGYPVPMMQPGASPPAATPCLRRALVPEAGLTEWRGAVQVQALCMWAAGSQ